ncbi:MAG TPA: hypothetical protein DIV40_06590 [Clostridiales bacterium]|nr:hypothetical protein [Clostridiales bacterium]
MKIEEGWKMYIDIKRLKGKGFSNTKIAEMLGISRPTVIKYMKMHLNFMEDIRKKQFMTRTIWC